MIAAEPAMLAARLREIATYFELAGDRHRAIAYARAAGSIEAAAPLLPRLLREGRLAELPGVGASLARSIDELARTGTVATLEALRARWPRAVVELAQLPGVGPVRARALDAALGVFDLDDLAAMCERGEIRGLKGFGKVSEARLRDAIRGRHARAGVLVLDDARDLARSLELHLRADPDVRRVEIAGAVRRWIEVIDRLALAVAIEGGAARAAAIEARLAAHPGVTAVTDGGPGVRIARLTAGLACAVHLAAPDRFGACWIEATGSAGHVDALRARSATGHDLPAAPDEPGVYRALGLPWIPPELRDGSDELALADAGDDFADLIELRDLTGAFHCHTTWSDGRSSVEAMATGARDRGYGLITITDHSAAASYAGGLDAQRLRDQAPELRAAALATGVRVLRGTEADILADGTIDVPPELLDELDVVIASVHQRHKQGVDAATARLVAAMRQPFFKVWGHALGRMLLRRDPIEVRLDDVLDAAADSGTVAIELNGDPHRLDLAPEHARAAAARGLRFVLSSDAHAVAQLDYAANAVAMARRARLRRRDVLNTLPPDALADAVRPRR